VGDSRRPLYFLVAACLTNIVLDLLLVIGADMGVTGAALGPSFPEVSAVLVLVVLMRSHTAYHLSLRRCVPRDLLRRVVQIGLPAGLQSVMYSISNVLIQAL
jgi:Na+-driven multidrug efflux pump